MYGQLTTGKPMFITSRIGKKHPAHRIELRIDTAKNQPEILKEQDIPDWESEHGTRVEIELVGKYLKGRQSVDEYLDADGGREPARRDRLQAAGWRGQVFKRATKELPRAARGDQAAPARRRARRADEDPEGVRVPQPSRGAEGLLLARLGQGRRRDLRRREAVAGRAARARSRTARPTRSTRRSRA